MSDLPPSGAPPAAGKPAGPVAVKGVLCVKCEHLNPPGIDQCEVCRGHLFVQCRECGAKNPRVNSRCQDCNRRLHKALGSRSRSRSEKVDRGIHLGYVALVLVAILLAIGILFFASGNKLPRFW